MKWQHWIVPLFFINLAVMGEVFAAEAKATVSFDKGSPKAGDPGSGKIVGSGSWAVTAPYFIKTITLIVTPTKDGEGVGDSPSGCDIKPPPPTPARSGSFTGSVTGLQPGTYNVSVQIKATADGQPDLNISTVPVQVTVE